MYFKKFKKIFKNALINTELYQYSYQKSLNLFKEIIELDKKSGSLLHHLPHHAKDMINTLQQDKQLWHTILENEKKRTEIKLLPKPCDDTLK